MRTEAKMWIAAAVVSLLVASSIAAGGRAAWIWSKAHLAQLLLSSAWRATRAGRSDARPWPWADCVPVAKLDFPTEDASFIVLSGASGRTMAFAPGHVDGTPLPGENGNSAISAHRDTHFALLRRLRTGDPIVVEDRHGRRHQYAVARSGVTDRRDTSILAPAAGPQLTLITCYPFDAIRPGGPLRYFVIARGSDSSGRAPTLLSSAEGREQKAEMDFGKFEGR
jgi:sortase A